MKSIVACGLALMLTVPAAAAFADENPAPAPAAPTPTAAPPAVPDTAVTKAAGWVHRQFQEHPVVATAVTAGVAYGTSRVVGDMTERPRKLVGAKFWGWASGKMARVTATTTLLTAGAVAFFHSDQGLAESAHSVVTSPFVIVPAVATVALGARSLLSRYQARRARNNWSWRRGRQAREATRAGARSLLDRSHR